MYESTDNAKSIFADFGKGELIVYPSDMYTATIDVSKGDFQPGIMRFHFDFAIEATPDLAISSARVGQHEVLESCSDAPDTCRAEVGMQTFSDTTSYAGRFRPLPRLPRKAEANLIQPFEKPATTNF